MKLTEQQIEAVKAATGLTPIAEDSAAQREFEPHFGVHTFYVDENGMFIFEPGAGGDEDAADGKVHGVQIAEWIRENDEFRVGVVAPTPVDLVLELKTD